MNSERQRLLQLFIQLAYEKRKVVLSSGRESDFYIDTKQASLSAEGHFLVGRLGLAAVRARHPGVQAVGGLTMGADPIASAISLTSFLAQRPARVRRSRRSMSQGAQGPRHQPVGRGQEGAARGRAGGGGRGRGHHRREHAQGGRALPRRGARGARRAGAGRLAGGRARGGGREGHRARVALRAERLSVSPRRSSRSILAPLLLGLAALAQPGCSRIPIAEPKLEGPYGKELARDTRRAAIYQKLETRLFLHMVWVGPELVRQQAQSLSEARAEPPTSPPRA